MILLFRSNCSRKNSVECHSNSERKRVSFSDDIEIFHMFDTYYSEVNYPALESFKKRAELKKMVDSAVGLKKMELSHCHPHLHSHSQLHHK
mmetsp:Transcript_1264/g.1978  ORF Transcript_1264/g.1978 Transcript_1264/m.1978 type:complete len:91 (-) Transcript_1264:75-347(-)